ncbi:MAG TPA: restriction endonuclease subunit S [Prevotellaceae bacterium]|nr:restriction endonuclease subunit S [Prevotellaceae bacterium]
MPYEIPSSWEWTTLGEVFTLQAGKNITAKDISDKEDSEHRFPCYGGNGLRGYVCSYNRNGRFPLIGRQGALCGNINFAEGLFYATEHAVVVETYCKTNVEWAVHSLIHLNLNQYATSTAQPGLSVSTINEVLIPLPPIEEQGRIVRCLNKWDTLIDQIEQGKVNLEAIIKQAKNKILDLAIHGKLVPQNPNDEPASELLKRINPKAEITCDNAHYTQLPFEVPQNWSWTTLGKIGKWQSGSTPNRLNKDYYNGNIPWLKTGDLNDGYITHIPEYITEKALNETSVKLNPTGSVLIAMYGATIGKIGILTFPATTNQACCACEVFKGIDREFIFLFLLSHREEFIKMGGGGAQPNISKEKIINTYIPLPPFTEQQRIINAVNKIFAQLDTIMESL